MAQLEIEKDGKIVFKGTKSAVITFLNSKGLDVVIQQPTT